MSLLSPDKFSGSDASNIPTPVKIARILMYVQAALCVLGGAWQGFTLVQVGRMSDAKVSQLTSGKIKHVADYPFPQAWTYTILLAVLGLVLAALALRFVTRQKSLRLITIVAQCLLVPISYLNAGILACIVILPAIAALAMLTQPAAKLWFRPESAAGGSDKDD
ncbi:MAG TPA: hypothetical protein VE172_22465 [Stackebrandtia sp.]|jgi:hypothetical protein|uniref:hypothetical protein n=1 Tax=Stackebrandtia sp. TaxID=2023065 RepID=UPI002D4AF3CA|nr:hypothetical protein [Stackebrandtia sp.]HZE41573.1 hypothetical protein [Stackebrandtia sp.]